MKFFDLFCGIGGFRLGMELSGHECIGSCEIDKYARQTYAKNFGHEPEYTDATKLDPKELPDFQCLCAGFPCQAFSLAGKRRGFEDTRGTLFFEIVRIAREKQPSVLLLENVKGLLFHEQGKTYRTILQALDDLGYDCEWQIINSKYFVPQNRDRIFIIGHLRGSGSRKVLPLREVEEGNVTSHGTLYAKDECSSTLTATYWKGYGGGRPMIAEPKLKVLKNSKDDSYRIYSTEGVSRTLRASPGGLGKMTGVYAEKKKTTMIYQANTNANMKQRVQERDETWTLTGNSNDFAILDEYDIRKLTPTECERLQGFPDGWTEGISDTQRYKCLGNAVTVTVIKYIGERL
jgi:DNA (cytosine-5)-methyltransferase 1